MKILTKTTYFKTTYFISMVAIMSLGLEVMGNEGLDTGNGEHVDIALLEEFSVDRTAEQVWEYFRGEKKGMWTGPYRTVKGEPDQEGEIFSYHLIDGRVQYPTVSYEIVRVEPFKHIVLAMWKHESKMQARKLFGYDIVNIEEKNGKTQVTFNQISFTTVTEVRSTVHGIINGPASPQQVVFKDLMRRTDGDEIRAFKLLQQEYISKIFIKLKKLIESNE